MEGTLQINSPVMEYTVGEYSHTIDTLTDHYSKIISASETIYGASWTGNAAQSHSDDFTGWAENYHQIIVSLAKMRDNLRQTHTSLTTAANQSRNVISEEFSPLDNSFLQW